jgi:RIO kinase 1
VVIDLPQVIDAAHNSQAEKFFLRDLDTIRRFCASLDPALAGEGDGREIWRAYVRRELTADFVPTGRAPEPRRAERPEGGHRQHAQRKPERPSGPRRPEPRSPRKAPAPVVVRVDRGQHGRPGAGHPPASPTAPAGGSPGRRKRRRRRRGGGGGGA